MKSYCLECRKDTENINQVVVEVLIRMQKIKLYKIINYTNQLLKN